MRSRHPIHTDACGAHCRTGQVGPSRFGSEAGATLVEVSIVLPLVLLLIFTILDGSRYIAAKNAVNTVSHEAARYGSSVGTGASTLNRYLECDAIRSAGISLSGGVDVLPEHISVDYDTGPSSTVSGSCPVGGPASTTPSEGDRIIVTVSRSWSAATPLVDRIFGPFVVTSVARRTILSP